MAKLGNDPFLRGAAPRVEKPAEAPPAPAARKITTPPAPAVTARQAKKVPRAQPAAKPRPAAPTPHAGSPKLVATVVAGQATPHDGSPKLVAAVAAGQATPHDGSPELVAAVAAGKATPHAGSPELVAAVVAGKATPHAGSPELVAAVVAGQPTPHAGSPELVAAVVAGQPTPHAGSPELVEKGVLRPPTPHAGSPVLVSPVVPRPPTPHAASPVLVEVVAPRPPTPHAGSPVVAVPRPPPHAASPVLVEAVAISSEPLTFEALPERAALADEASLAQADGTSLRSRAAGALTLAREVVGQVFDSRTVGRTVSAAEGLWRAATCAIGVSGSVDLDDYGRDATLVSSLQPVFDFFYERYWRVRVEGIDHVPEGPAILVANHSGALPFDGPMVAQALVRERADLNQARWLLEDQVFHAPFLGTLANRLGAIRACPENALRLLDEERPIIVFPEGIQGIGKTYKDRYQLKRFGRGGFVKLALRAGAPIIPVAVVGAEESMPVLFKLPGGLFGVPYLPVTPLGPLPLPARWAIRFGEPIDLGGATADDEHDLPRVQRLAERTRESIQGMLTALLEERSSVF